MVAVGVVALGGLGAVALAWGREGGGAGSGFPIVVVASDLAAAGTAARTVIAPAQPEAWMVSDEILPAQNCFICHAGVDEASVTEKPYRWRGSMHAHAMRDPIFQAAFVVAEQDAPGIGELCIRCHSPRGWLEGRASAPTGSHDGSTLDEVDIDNGVNCNACHRMVDPVYTEGASPADDAVILAGLEMAGGPGIPVGGGNARVVVDPMDVRRGPFEDAAAPHVFRFSPFHASSALCGTCHDVSNPLMSRVGGATPGAGDSYALNGAGPHPTQNKRDMFPEQRTYSEWLNSSFAQGGVEMNGLFNVDPNDPEAPATTVVSECQECHMPNRRGYGCWEVFEPPERRDIPYHAFAGANVFAADLLLHLYGPAGTNEFDLYTLDSLAKAKADAMEMLGKAAEVSVSQFAGELKVRTENNTGHKLLTGMPEGKRIWVNVRFFAWGALVAERGGYDGSSATLDGAGTKVYEAALGLDEPMAALVGLPAGSSFHLAAVNSVVKDNRIPPRGFTNAGFEAVQAAPVGYAYADGQYWDNTRYCIPAGATRAEVRLYYQTSSREYIEFLRDRNTTDARGVRLANAWAAVGKSAPVLMDEAFIDFAPFVRADVTGDGAVSFADITAILSNWGRAGDIGVAEGDGNCDGLVGFGDIVMVLTNWGVGGR